MRLLLFIVPVLIFSCSIKTEEKVAEIDISSDTIVKYAKGFSIHKFDSAVYRLTVKKPFQGAEEGFSYWLIPKDIQVVDSLLNKNIIRTPLKELVVTSTSHLPMLDYLSESASLVGFPSLKYISSEIIRKRIDSGLVEELGRDNSLNFEVLVELQPELVMTYMLSGDRNQLERITNAGIPVMINADYQEHHPLGRAEWIKVGGLLFNKLEKADSIFNAVAEKYNSLKIKKEESDSLPTVMTGIMYGDTWYLPGGQNYAANILKDAGMKYLWKDNEESGFLELSFEAVYDKAKNADYWIGTASFEELVSLKNADSRYTWFDAYESGHVYTYTKRSTPDGGNDYLEQGYLRPDLILADIIKIVYEKNLNEKELYFYKKIK